MTPVNGILICEFGEVGLFVDGLREGTHRSWYSSRNETINGQLKSISNWQKGNRKGEDVSFNIYGDIERNYNYINGKLHGECKWWEGGKIIRIKNYYKGIQIGKYEEFSSRGDVLKRGFYKNGKLHGVYNEWYNSRQLKLKCNYYNGGLDGQYVKYYYNGRLEESGKYRYGLQVGEWKYWYRNGKLKGEGRFVGGNGTEIGSSGIPQNKREGKWSFWREDGEFEGLHNYENGELDYYLPTEEIFDRGLDIFLETR